VRLEEDPGEAVHFTLSLSSAAEALPEILRVAREGRVEVRSLSVQPPDLETVFLHLTGERLAEASS
jgi:hypothetical protein